MNSTLPPEIVEQLVQEQRHFTAAPEAFFQAWKRGAELAGPEWFGDGTQAGLQQATSKWELRPNLLAVGVPLAC